MSWTAVPASALSSVPWRNGLGTSRNIATALTPDGELLWQIGIADLERDSPFSSYPQMDRIFTPISRDTPPALAFGDGPFEPCPLLMPKPFPGDVPTRCRVAAPGRAFNAIVDRRTHRAEVRVEYLEPGATPAIPMAELAVLHCLEGRMSAGPHALGPGDSARHDGGDTPSAPVALDRSIAIIAAIFRV